MLAVIDYGGGNIGSLLGALRRRGAAFRLTASAEDLLQAHAAVLPGDGAFSATMDALRARGFDRAIHQFVHSGKPFLGICVGMQVLFEESDEFGRCAGLGVLPGAVARFTSAAPRVPHMGWNRLEVLGGHPFVHGLGDEPYAYFLHSYRAPVGADTVAAATHGERFSAIVARANVMGTQFHPEKSRLTGARLIDNFLRLAGEARA
jgi:glutamine amidotransferase